MSTANLRLVRAAVAYLVEAVGEGFERPEQALVKYSGDSHDPDWEGLADRIGRWLLSLIQEASEARAFANATDLLAQEGWGHVRSLREALEMVRDSAAWNGVGLTEGEKRIIERALQRVEGAPPSDTLPHRKNAAEWEAFDQEQSA